MITSGKCVVVQTGMSTTDNIIVGSVLLVMMIAFMIFIYFAAKLDGKG